jgi:hypothetical protein
VLEQAGPRPRGGAGRPQGGLRLEVLEILEDLGRIEDLQRPVDQHRHLPLGIDPHDVGMFGLVQPFHFERHHDEFEVDALFERRDLRLRAEHAQRAGKQAHRRRAGRLAH